jgi:hypothetical protein
MDNKVRSAKVSYSNGLSTLKSFDGIKIEMLDLAIIGFSITSREEIDEIINELSILKYSLESRPDKCPMCGK